VTVVIGSARASLLLRPSVRDCPFILILLHLQRWPALAPRDAPPLITGTGGRRDRTRWYTILEPVLLWPIHGGLQATPPKQSVHILKS
jgi:hypothetical protein